MGVRGGHKTIDYSFKRSKRSLSGIMGKAIPQLGPSVAENGSFKEFSTGLRERYLIGHVSEIVFRGQRSE